MAKFNSEYYRYFRPFYPKEIFVEPIRYFLNRKNADPLSLLDVGCGTGHSIVSAIRAGLKGIFIGVDPDRRMLEQARNLIEAEGLAAIDLREGTGEVTGLPDHSIELILVGSAFHWMNASSAKEEFFRILQPKGGILLFEYQFPKAKHLPSLNEWIRRQFNLYWKAPLQKPRGTFAQITHVFVKDHRFKEIAQSSCLMEQKLSATELLGMILSQSRVLCFEETLSALQVEEFRMDLLRVLKIHLGEESHAFEFKLNGVFLSKP